jgi:LmbE family N-acetylglucosaminyl deacetylase
MKVLVLGSHCDDIELGCGGTLHNHRNDWDVTCVTFMKHADHIPYADIWKHSERAMDVLGVSRHYYLDFPVNNHSEHRQKMWEALHELDIDIQPDVVITQYSDEQQDHAALYLETLRNFRKASVYAYRSSIRNCMNFNASAFEVITRKDVDAKLEALSFYPDWYQGKVYFNSENVVAMLRTQGVYVEAEFAECFVVVKKVGIG